MKSTHPVFSCFAKAVLCIVLCWSFVPSAFASGAVRKDSIKVWGEVSDLFSGDKLEKGLVTVFNERDSIVLVDSIYGPRKRYWGTYEYMEPAGYNFKLPHGGEYKIRFDIEGYVAEPQDLHIPDRQYHKYTTEWMKNYKVRKNPREHMLGEAVVRATRIKMVVKGDTVEYDADAFNLAEGSMLDKLISEMPGMQIKDNGEIYHNGRKVESLLVDGKDFFNGDPKMALDNLPAYTVKKVKVYRKDDEASYLIRDSLKREDMKKLVVDVRLKKEYQKGWIGNTDLAYGTHNRFATRMSLIYFSSVWKFMGYANFNNTNQASTPNDNGEFSNGGDATQGIIYSKQGGARIMYDKGKIQASAGLHGTHQTSYNETETSTTTYLNTGDTYMRSRNRSRNSTSTIRGNTRIANEGNNSWSAFYPISFSWSRTRGMSSTKSATFSGDPKDNHRLASLDSLFMPLGSARLEQMRLNTVLNATQTVSRTSNINSSMVSFFRSPIYGNEMQFTYNFGYSDSHVDNYQQYTLDNRQTATIDHQNIYALTPSSSLNANAHLNYNLKVTERLSFDLSYDYGFNREKNNPNRYRLDSIPGWDDFNRHPMGMLPSTQDSLSLARDLRNSYHRTTITSHHQPSIAGRLKLFKDWRLYANLSFNFEQDAIKDTRYNHGQRRNAHLNSLIPEVQLNSYSFDDKTGEVSSYNIYCRQTTTLPSLSYLLDLVDDTDPLFISRGNPDLKNIRTTSAGINYWRSYAKHMQNYGYQIAWNHTGNAVASTTTYDRSTGITTYKPRNINGNWSINGFGGGSRAVDKKDRLTIELNVNFNYNHNVDYITEMTNQIPTPLRSVVHNYNVGDNFKVSYKIKKYKVEAFGRTTWRIQRSNRDNFTNVNATDFSYGINSNGPIVAGFEYDTRFTVYSRRGYNDASMNDNHSIWDLALSRAFLKSKALVLRLEAHDLLGQLSNVENVVNAQGRTERWYNSVPRYALLHVCYKFNTMSKKKGEQKSE